MVVQHLWLQAFFGLFPTISPSLPPRLPHVCQCEGGRGHAATSIGGSRHSTSLRLEERNPGALQLLLPGCYPFLVSLMEGHCLVSWTRGLDQGGFCSLLSYEIWGVGGGTKCDNERMAKVKPGDLSLLLNNTSH